MPLFRSEGARMAIVSCWKKILTIIEERESKALHGHFGRDDCLGAPAHSARFIGVQVLGTEERQPNVKCGLIINSIS